MKKSLVLIFTLVLAGIGVGQDSSSSQESMENADMSDGTTHWHGNVKPAGADDTTDFITKPGSATGIQVDLHSTSWTKVTQEIHQYKSHGPMLLTIVYQTSPDLSFSTHEEDYTNLGPLTGFGGATILPSKGEITAFIDMPPPSRSSMTSANGIDTVLIYPDLVASASFAPKTAQSPQTFTVKLSPPVGTHDDVPTFVLAIPPGHGSITITKISLLPGTASLTPGQ
jgi:hypothetical protein